MLQRVKDTIDETIMFASGETDWIKIKLLIMRSVPVEYKKMFSRRDDKNHHIGINEFELQIIEYWKTKTGVLLKPHYDKKLDRRLVKMASKHPKSKEYIISKLAPQYGKNEVIDYIERAKDNGKLILNDDGTFYFKLLDIYEYAKA